MPLFIDLTPDSTFDKKGANEVIIRATAKYKVRLTLVLCCLADGSKLPSMIIFKESSGKLPKKLQNAYDDTKIVIKANSKGWMNKEVLKEWVKEIWTPYIMKHDKSFLMVWDSFSVHKDKAIIDSLAEEKDTEVAIIPGGCTSVLQPLDVGINKPLKDYIRKKFQAWMVDQLLKPTGII